ncbi:uncharacterized protein [Aquarana catesbeiana]|uniref:uncharacterized protein isoform X2 n=1 Tax=Aquarana catesbeiana TaxID=8400 RepID=UPI003CCA2358
MTSPCRRTAERRRRLVAVESGRGVQYGDGTLTNNTLEIFHSPVKKMEDKGDNDISLCEDDLSNKLKVRKRRSARRTSRMSASVGRESTFRTNITAPSDQTKTSNPDSCEEENLDGHDGFSAQQKNIWVKEEHVSSGEEDLSWKEEEHVSSREADTSGKVEEDVSSREEGTSSGANDLGNTETFLVQDSPDTQHKQKQDVLKLGRSKEISEDLRKQVVEAHKSGKGYKRIAKNLNLHLSTVRKIIYKWKKFSTVATLPRSGRPTKIGAKARNTILKHIRDNTTVTAKDLKASLALDNINVHESTIRKTLSKWCSWDFTMEEDTALQQE